jgi:hypothetical protein
MKNSYLLKIQMFTVLAFVFFSCKEENPKIEQTIFKKSDKKESSSWESIPELGTDIGIGANGCVFITGVKEISGTGGFEIKTWQKNTWKTIEGAGLRIAVDPKGRPWIIDKANLIFRYNGKKWIQMPGKGTDIGIGADGSVFIIGTEEVSPTGGKSIMKWNGSSWTQLPGAAIRISVDNKGRPWVINKSKLIFRFDGPPYWTTLPGTGTDIGIGKDGSVYITSDSYMTDGYSIKKWDGNNWTGVEGEGVNIAVSPKGIPWTITSSNKILKQK